MFIGILNKTPKVGPAIGMLHSRGKLLSGFEFLASEKRTRAHFFFETKIDPAWAEFGNLFKQKKFRQYVTSAVFIGQLKNATCIGSDAVVCCDGRVIPDTMSHVSHWHRGSAVSAPSPDGKFSLKESLEIYGDRYRGPYFLGFNGAWRNYAHWMGETLPRLFCFLTARIQNPGLRVVLPNFGPNSFQQQTLDLLGVHEDEVYRIDDSQAILFDELFIAIGIDIWTISSVLENSSKLLTEASLLSPMATRSYPERVYIRRAKGARTVENFEELRPLIESANFSIIDMEDVSLIEQILIMNAANCVIAEHGAGLQNIQFCRAPCKVLEIFNPVCVQPAFWTIASTINLDYGYIVGEHFPTKEHPTPTWNSNYTVPRATMEEAILKMIDS